MTTTRARGPAAGAVPGALESSFWWPPPDASIVLVPPSPPAPGMALYNAAAAGDLSALQAALATADADLEWTDKIGYTAFLAACFKGHVECIAALAGAGCDKAARSSGGHTGLMCAAASGSAAAVEVEGKVVGVSTEAMAGEVKATERKEETTVEEVKVETREAEVRTGVT